MTLHPTSRIKSRPEARQVRIDIDVALAQEVVVAAAERGIAVWEVYDMALRDWLAANVEMREAPSGDWSESPVSREIAGGE